MTEPTKPEALFEGVEWVPDGEFAGPAWTVTLSGVDFSVTLLSSARWCGFVGVGDTEMSFSDAYDDRAEALSWLRAQVLKARDELCAVTGTVAVPKEGR